MIPQIKNILFATDLTENSLYAFYFAADLAQKYDARIIILHCVSTLHVHVYSEGLTPDLAEGLQEGKKEEKKEDVTDIEKRLQQFFQNIEPQIGALFIHLVSEVIVKEGDPAEEILETADNKGCDVIVLGAHGKGWLEQTCLGSVASSVLERTRKPVYIIPLPSKRSSMEEIGTL
jgi:nucleotide-binding universal stress UspA family protein